MSKHHFTIPSFDPTINEITWITPELKFVDFITPIKEFNINIDKTSRQEFIAKFKQYLTVLAYHYDIQLQTDTLTVTVTAQYSILMHLYTTLYRTLVSQNPGNTTISYLQLTDPYYNYLVQQLSWYGSCIVRALDLNYTEDHLDHTNTPEFITKITELPKYEDKVIFIDPETYRNILSQSCKNIITLLQLYPLDVTTLDDNRDLAYSYPFVVVHDQLLVSVQEVFQDLETTAIAVPRVPALSYPGKHYKLQTSIASTTLKHVVKFSATQQRELVVINYDTSIDAFGNEKVTGIYFDVLTLPLSIADLEFSQILLEQNPYAVYDTVANYYNLINRFHYSKRVRYRYDFKTPADYIPYRNAEQLFNYNAQSQSYPDIGISYLDFTEIASNDQEKVAYLLQEETHTNGDFSFNAAEVELVEININGTAVYSTHNIITFVSDAIVDSGVFYNLSYCTNNHLALKSLGVVMSPRRQLLQLKEIVSFITDTCNLASDVHPLNYQHSEVVSMNLRGHYTRSEINFLHLYYRNNLLVDSNFDFGSNWTRHFSNMLVAKQFQYDLLGTLLASFDIQLVLGGKVTVKLLRQFLKQLPVKLSKEITTIFSSKQKFLDFYNQYYVTCYKQTLVHNLEAVQTSTNFTLKDFSNSYAAKLHSITSLAGFKSLEEIHADVLTNANYEQDCLTPYNIVNNYLGYYATLSANMRYWSANHLQVPSPYVAHVHGTEQNFITQRLAYGLASYRNVIPTIVLQEDLVQFMSPNNQPVTVGYLPPTELNFAPQLFSLDKAFVANRFDLDVLNRFYQAYLSDIYNQFQGDPQSFISKFNVSPKEVAANNSLHVNLFFAKNMPEFLVVDTNFDTNPDFNLRYKTLMNASVANVQQYIDKYFVDIPRTDKIFTMFFDSSFPRQILAPNIHLEPLDQEPLVSYNRCDMNVVMEEVTMHNIINVPRLVDYNIYDYFGQHQTFFYIDQDATYNFEIIPEGFKFYFSHGGIAYLAELPFYSCEHMVFSDAEASVTTLVPSVSYLYHRLVTESVPVTALNSCYYEIYQQVIAYASKAYQTEKNEPTAKGEIATSSQEQVVTINNTTKKARTTKASTPSSKQTTTKASRSKSVAKSTTASKTSNRASSKVSATKKETANKSTKATSSTATSSKATKNTRTTKQATSTKTTKTTKTNRVTTKATKSQDS